MNDGGSRSAFEFRLLGGLSVGQFESESRLQLPRKPKALLAYLALNHGYPQSREKLSALFWEGSPEEQARVNLRKCLSVLRKQIGDVLQTEDDDVTLNSDAIGVDAHRFKQLVKTGNIGSLEQASEMYKGDLLDGFSLKEEAFEAWLRTEREQYRHMMVEGLTKLITHFESSQMTAPIVKYATVLLSIDRLNEQGHLSLMHAYAAQGRHDAALKQFDLCRQILARELDVQPKPEMVQAASDIRKARRQEAKKPLANAPASKTVKSEADAFFGAKLPDKPSIAVVPFDNLSGDPEQRYFSDGITEDIITALSRFRELSVISRNSSFAFTGQSISLLEVGRELGVNYLLEGSVRKAADKVRVTAQLIDVGADKYIWAERYDRNFEDIFELQDDVVTRISGTLVGRLAHERYEQTQRLSPNRLRAYDLFLRGRELFFNWSFEDNQAARVYLQEAIEIEPDFAAALALLSETLLRMFLSGWGEDPERDLAESFAIAKRAVEIDDQDSRVHTALGMAYIYQRDLDRAKYHFDTALRLNPNDTRVLAYYSRQAMLDSRTADAIELCNRATTLNPYGKYGWNLGIVFFGAHEYGRAIEHLSSITNPPMSPLSILAACYAMIGDESRAIATRELFLEAARGCAATSRFTRPEEWREFFILRWPFRLSSELDHLLKSLCRAGIPVGD